MEYTETPRDNFMHNYINLDYKLFCEKLTFKNLASYI
jgi:hypothetical protein